MKRLFLFVVLCLAAAAGLKALDGLPADTAPLVREKYNSWSGVIRVWVVADMKIGAGSPHTWLTACAAKAERRGAGIYIDVQSVPADAVTNFAATGINPPDMIVYPASMKVDTENLAELTAEYPLRAGLDENSRAAPLLTDARFWIYRGELPSDMYAVKAACRQSDLGAMTALSTGLRTGESGERTLPGIDLGLSGASVRSAAPAGDTRCRASAELVITDNPLEAFMRGEADAFIGSLADIGLLADESGWEARLTGEIALVADMAVCSIVNKPDSEGRKAACEDFLTYLLGEGQELCARTGAMPAASNASAYAGNANLAAIEAALDNVKCVRTYDAARVRLYIEGKLTADEAMTPD